MLSRHSCSLSLLAATLASRLINTASRTRRGTKERSGGTAKRHGGGCWVGARGGGGEGGRRRRRRRDKENCSPGSRQLLRQTGPRATRGMPRRFVKGDMTYLITRAER